MRTTFLLCASIVLSLSACNKFDHTSEEALGVNLVIQGRLVQDCSLQPQAGVPLRFYTYHLEGFGPSKIFEDLAFDTTDQDGRFSVSVLNTDLENIKMAWNPTGNLDDQSQIVASYEWPQKPESGKAYDWGYCFFGGREYPARYADMEITFHKENFPDVDSIFVGIDKNTRYALSTQASEHMLKIQSGNSKRPSSLPDSVYLTWATRRSAYDSSFQNHGVSSGFKPNRVIVPTYQCNLGQTQNIDLK